MRRDEFEPCYGEKVTILTDGERIDKVPFLMVDRERIVMVLAHAEAGAETPDRASPAALTQSARLLLREAATARRST